MLPLNSVAVTIPAFTLPLNVVAVRVPLTVESWSVSSILELVWIPLLLRQVVQREFALTQVVI